MRPPAVRAGKAYLVRPVFWLGFLCRHRLPGTRPVAGALWLPMGHPPHSAGRAPDFHRLPDSPASRRAP